MKILHLLNGQGIGGISAMVNALVQEQSKNSNTEPTILYGKLSNVTRKFHSESGVEFHHVNVRSGYDLSPFAAHRIIEIFKTVDILHFHYFSPIYALCAVISGTPTVYTFHGTFGILRKKTIKDYLKRILLKYFVRTTIDTVTYNSNFTKKYAENMYSIKNTNTMVIYNGLNIESIVGDPSRLPEDIQARTEPNFTIGACGRLVEIKRIDRLIEAFAAFQKEKPDVSLLIVGDGPLREALETKIRMLGLSNNAVITGYKRNVFDYEATFDICVVPSTGEAFGLVALEALAMGKPAIVFEDGGGLVEIVEGCSPEDVVSSIDELTERLDFHYEHRYDNDEKAEHLRSHANQFHIEKTADDFVQAYRMALAAVGKLQ